jgi:hypothetical protein
VTYEHPQVWRGDPWRYASTGSAPAPPCRAIHRRRGVEELAPAELGLDRERARLWTVAHTVAWGLDEEPLAEHIEAATWLLDTG